jgi:hypothetical protein
MLHRAGCAASLLPLFGNIPIIDAPNIEWLYKKLASLDSAENFVRDRSGFWMLGFFGALHRQWKPEPFFTILRRAAHKAGKRVCLLSIGRLGAGEIHWDQFALKYEKDFYFLKLGEQPAERISQFLQYVDLGVAASTWQLIGKSGTASAMLDHGLPVIVTRDEVQSLDAIDVSPPIHALLHRCDPSLEMKLAAGITKQPPRHRAEGTTARFLAPLLCCL